jgi:hypothetical protein
VQRLTRVIGHRVRPGRLDPTLLEFGERAVATAFGAPVDDFRDPDLARAWGAEIADAVAGRPGRPALPAACGSAADGPWALDGDPGGCRRSTAWR